MTSSSRHEPPAVHDPACAAPRSPPRARVPRPGAAPTLANGTAAGGIASLGDPSGRLLEEGPDGLATQELIAVLLATPGRPREALDDARAVLLAFETARRVANASVGELRVAAGLSADAAARLAAACALGRRAGAELLPRGAPLSSSAEIFERYHPVFSNARRERFLCVMLDAKNRVMRHEAISEGSLTSSLVHPREVFSAAIRESASGLVFVHNHPSGDPEPSAEDHEITRRLCSAGELLGIRVMDHVVVGDGAFVSFLDRGLIALWT